MRRRSLAPLRPLGFNAPTTGRGCPLIFCSLPQWPKCDDQPPATDAHCAQSRRPSHRRGLLPRRAGALNREQYHGLCLQSLRGGAAQPGGSLCKHRTLRVAPDVRVGMCSGTAARSAGADGEAGATTGAYACLPAPPRERRVMTTQCTTNLHPGMLVAFRMFLARRRFARPGPRAVHLLTMIIRSARPSRREGYAERAPPPSNRSLLPRGYAHAPPPPPQPRPPQELQARLRTTCRARPPPAPSFFRAHSQRHPLGGELAPSLPLSSLCSWRRAAHDPVTVTRRTI